MSIRGLLFVVLDRRPLHCLKEKHSKKFKNTDNYIKEKQKEYINSTEVIDKTYTSTHLAIPFLF